MEKIWEIGLKTKNLCTAKNTIKRKKTSRNEKKYLQTMYMILKTYPWLIKVNKNKANNIIKRICKKFE